jgi:hypothetical protein
VRADELSRDRQQSTEGEEPRMASQRDRPWTALDRRCPTEDQVERARVF